MTRLTSVEHCRAVDDTSDSVEHGRAVDDISYSVERGRPLMTRLTV